MDALTKDPPFPPPGVRTPMEGPWSQSSTCKAQDVEAKATQNLESRASQLWSINQILTSNEASINSSAAITKYKRQFDISWSSSVFIDENQLINMIQHQPKLSTCDQPSKPKSQSAIIQLSWIGHQPRITKYAMNHPRAIHHQLSTCQLSKFKHRACHKYNAMLS